MEKDERSNAFILFFIATVVFLGAFVLFLAGILEMLFFKPFIFFYILAVILLVFRLYFYKTIRSVAHSMGFSIVTSIFHQPKIEGTYKGHHWQIHYRSKEAGKFGGILRTYIKLISKKPMKFDVGKLASVAQEHKGFRIIAVRHIIREDKNYLLMKVSTYIFDKKKLHELMDHLIQIRKEAEL